MRHPMRTFLLAAFALVILALFGAGQGARADQRNPDALIATPTPTIIDSGELVLDEEVTGTFKPKEPSIFAYVYNGTKGEKLIFTLQSGKGLKSFLSVLTPDKATFKFDGGKTSKSVAADSGKTATLKVTLPGKGRFLIGVTATGNTSGDFSLTVAADVATASDNPDIEDDSFPAEIDPKGTPKQVVNRLLDAGVVPSGGKQLLTIPESFGTSSDPNFGYLRLGRGTQIQNMVLQFEMGWSRAGKTSGCGMVFRAANNDLKNFWYAMLTNDKKALLIHAEDGTNQVEYSKDSEKFIPDRYNYVTLVILDDKVAFYINGALEAVKISKGTIEKGVFAIQIYNDENAPKTTTDCRYQNIWAWSYD